MAGVAGALYVPQVGIINPGEFAPGQLDRGGDLGRGRRARHARRADHRRHARQLRQDLVHRRAARTGSSPSAASSSPSRCSCRRASSARSPRAGRRSPAAKLAGGREGCCIPARRAKPRAGGVAVEEQQNGDGGTASSRPLPTSAQKDGRRDAVPPLVLGAPHPYAAARAAALLADDTTGGCDGSVHWTPFWSRFRASSAWSRTGCRFRTPSASPTRRSCCAP